MTHRVCLTQVVAHKDGWLPDIPDDIPWVGMLIFINGNPRYLIKVPWSHRVWVQTGTDPDTGEAQGEMQLQAHPDAVDLSSTPGVLGPITRAAVRNFLEQRGTVTVRGATVEQFRNFRRRGID